jgi:hypothetical protein
LKPDLRPAGRLQKRKQHKRKKREKDNEFDFAFLDHRTFPNFQRCASYPLPITGYWTNPQASHIANQSIFAP